MEYLIGAAIGAIIGAIIGWLLKKYLTALGTIDNRSVCRVDDSNIKIKATANPDTGEKVGQIMYQVRASGSIPEVPPPEADELEPDLDQDTPHPMDYDIEVMEAEGTIGVWIQFKYWVGYPFHFDDDTPDCEELNPSQRTNLS